MNGLACNRIALGDLADYVAGDLPDADVAAFEEHLFSCVDCAARAAEFDALDRGIRAAARAADFNGFVTDAVLNRLARDGVRVRTFALSPGAVVPCAVWDDDELMVVRLRADLGGATEYTLSQRVAGEEVHRLTGQTVVPTGEILYAQPASWIRTLPVVNVEMRLTTHEGGDERVVGSYTLLHEGALHR